MKKYLPIVLVIAFIGVLVIVNRSKNQPAAATPIDTQTAITQPASSPVSSTAPAMSAHYKDGTYTGSVANSVYGDIQVQAVVKNGQLADVVALKYPNDNRTSSMVSSQSLPVLKQEALQAQSGQVDVVSGASQTSAAYAQSLTQALQQAQ